MLGFFHYFSCEDFNIKKSPIKAIFIKYSINKAEDTSFRVTETIEHPSHKVIIQNYCIILYFDWYMLLSE